MDGGDALSCGSHRHAPDWLENSRCKRERKLTIVRLSTITNKITAEAEARLKSLLSNAVWYINSTMVCRDRAGVPAGPPSVQRSLKRDMASMVPVIRRKTNVGRRLGMVINHQVCKGPAPLSTAASYSSARTACSPAWKMSM